MAMIFTESIVTHASAGKTMTVAAWWGLFLGDLAMWFVGARPMRSRSTLLEWEAACRRRFEF